MAGRRREEEGGGGRRKEEEGGGGRCRGRVCEVPVCDARRRADPDWLISGRSPLVLSGSLKVEEARQRGCRGSLLVLFSLSHSKWRRRPGSAAASQIN